MSLARSRLVRSLALLAIGSLVAAGCGNNKNENNAGED